MAKVMILGGGFGGLAAAHELRTLLGDGHDVTLVDRAGQFYMGFAKLWDLGGIRPLADGTGDLARLGSRGIEFVQSAITGIDPERREVTTDRGTLTADALLVALGAGANPVHLDMLSADGAHDLYDGDQLPAMRRDLEAVSSGRVVVSILGAPFKCPPAPYEAALIVDELLRGRGVRDAVDVMVTTPQPITLPAAGPDASRYVADHLVERGVELVAQQSVKAVDGASRRITLGDGTTVDYSILLGVPSNVPPPVVRESALAGESGWVEPDKRTFRTRFDHVYAVGDCTLVPNVKGQLPKAGVFAAAEGRVAANNIAVDLVGGKEVLFDGHGYCFLELPGRKVAYIEGDFLAEPELDVHITEASVEQFARKQAFERELLDAWLG